jgi:hypothetical protein
MCGVSVLVGCASPVPHLADPTQTAAITVSPSDTLTPSATPEQKQINDPADPDSWLVTERAIGPIEIGADYESTLAAIRSTGVGTFDCEGVAYGFAADNAYDILVIKDREGDSDGITEVSIGWNSDTMGVGPRTAESLGLGSTKEQVLAAYDDAAEQGSQIAGHTYVTISDKTGASKLVFGYRDGYDGAVSVSVITGSEPAYEPCA